MKRTALVLAMGYGLTTQVMAAPTSATSGDAAATAPLTSTSPVRDTQPMPADTGSSFQEAGNNASVTAAVDPNQPPVSAGTDSVSQAPVVTNTVEPVTPTAAAAKVPATPSMTPDASSAAAAEALKQKEGDATKKENLEQVFTASERQYSLQKKGSYSGTYDVDYTYYQDQQLDLALSDSSSTLTRLRIENVATHNITNTFTVQYGVLDNLTLTASLPLVAKSDTIKNTSIAGLGDVGVGARWEPFPIKQGRLPLVLFGNLSSKTGDSPYEISAEKDLPTGKGYYSAGIGASTRKYIDPVVLFASASANYGLPERGLNQVRGSRILTEFEPGISGGFAFGFAYSFNYDVSLTMSYQQSFNTASKYTFSSGETSKPADQSSATLGISLGVRVTPKTIVNGSVGIGLTPDAPSVSLGLSLPLDIIGFGRDVR